MKNKEKYDLRDLDIRVASYFDFSGFSNVYGITIYNTKTATKVARKEFTQVPADRFVYEREIFGWVFEWMEEEYVEKGDQFVI